MGTERSGTAEVILPEGGHLRLVVFEADGTTGEVDLTESAALLLELGGPGEEAAEREQATSEFGYLEASDDVTFLVDGADVEPGAALERMGRGLVEVLRAAVRDVPAQ